MCSFGDKRIYALVQQVHHEVSRSGNELLRIKLCNGYVIPQVSKKLNLTAKEKRHFTKMVVVTLVLRKAL